MQKTTTLKALLLATLVSGFAILGGCEKKVAQQNEPPPAYEGKYRNSSGQVVLEIKEGRRAIFTNHSTQMKTDTSFSPSGNDLMVESSSGNFTMKFQPPDTITGLPVAIAGDSAPLKKVR